MAEGREEVSEEELQKQLKKIVEQHLADRVLIKRDDIRMVLEDLYKLYGEQSVCWNGFVRNAFIDYYSIMLLKEIRKLDIFLMQGEFDSLGDEGDADAVDAADEVQPQEETVAAAAAVAEQPSAYPAGLPLV
jgi:hypothetical protein